LVELLKHDGQNSALRRKPESKFMNRYRILTDAFGSPKYFGGCEDGEPVWVSRPMAYLFNEESAELVLLAVRESTLEEESLTEPNYSALRVQLWPERFKT
jgi:hypothetical protein